MSATFRLISHALCPYVQRACIVLLEKGIEFERIDIDLANKPGWFRHVSPLGKTPVLLVGDQAIFESAAICEYLDEIRSPQLHPQDPLRRAQHRAWMEFGSTVLNNIAAFYSAETEPSINAKAAELASKFKQVEAVLDNGPYFMGEGFTIVDAVFAPIFRYFDVFDDIADFGVFTDAAKLNAWRRHLSARPSVQKAVGQDYPQRLNRFLRAKDSALSKRISTKEGEVRP